MKTNTATGGRGQPGQSFSSRRRLATLAGAALLLLGGCGKKMPHPPDAWGDAPTLRRVTPDRYVVEDDRSSAVNDLYVGHIHANREIYFKHMPGDRFHLITEKEYLRVMAGGQIEISDEPTPTPTPQPHGGGTK